MREIGSAAVEELTSSSLVELRGILQEARTQRQELMQALSVGRAKYQQDSAELNRRKHSLLRFFYKARISELETSIPEVSQELSQLEGWLKSTHIDIQFDSSDGAKKAYGRLIRSFQALIGCQAIWDITSDRTTNRATERTAASRALLRTTIQLEFTDSELVRFDGRAMLFGNANGENILLYPGIALMPRADGQFALIDLRELSLEFTTVQFIEEDPVPADARVVGKAWAKSNKDGTPDLRFKGNYQIPICLYGRILFTSPGGIEEEYQFSNADAGRAFAEAFKVYKMSLTQSQ